MLEHPTPCGNAPSTCIRALGTLTTFCRKHADEEIAILDRAGIPYQLEAYLNQFDKKCDGFEERTE